MTTRTIIAQTLDQSPSTFFGIFDVRETCSRYRVLVHRGGGSVSVALLNWGTSCEYGHLPTHEHDAYNIAEHLTNGNMVDAANLVHVFGMIARDWDTAGPVREPAGPEGPAGDAAEVRDSAKLDDSTTMQEGEG